MRSWMAVLVAVGFLTADARAASLYLPVGDGRLRSDLQLLIDGGVLDLSVLAWPLPRADAERALADARVSDDSPYEQVLARVRAVVTAPVPGLAARVVAGHPGLLRDFESAGREDGNLTVTASTGETNWSATGVLTAVTSADDHHPVRLDGSELTLHVGNWLLSQNLMDRWWGPGQQGSLILSSNARPIPAVMIATTTAPSAIRPITMRACG